MSNETKLGFFRNPSMVFMAFFLAGIAPVFGGEGGENAADPPQSGQSGGSGKTLEQRVAELEKREADKSIVHVGKGSLRFDGLIQLWYLHDDNADDRFRVRRSELRATGDILGDDRVTFSIMFDPAQVQEDGTRKSPLQDVSITLKDPSIPNHKLDIGQFKTPITEEGIRSSAKLDFAERAFISRTFGDQRDQGAMITGDWPALTYQVGVFNGSGQNQADTNDQKDFAGRVVLRPFELLGLTGGDNDLGKLEIGASGYTRKAGGASFDKERRGFDARYELGNLSLEWEYMYGKGTASGNSTTENGTKANGWYAQAGYFLDPKLQALARLDSFDPNESVSGDRVKDLTLGVNYFIAKQNAKFFANYIRKTEQGPSVNNDQVILGVQVYF